MKFKSMNFGAKQWSNDQTFVLVLTREIKTSFAEEFRAIRSNWFDQDLTNGQSILCKHILLNINNVELVEKSIIILSNFAFSFLQTLAIL
jgi:hypothetical protein